MRQQLTQEVLVVDQDREQKLHGVVKMMTIPDMINMISKMAVQMVVIEVVNLVKQVTMMMILSNVLMLDRIIQMVAINTQMRANNNQNIAIVKTMILRKSLMRVRKKTRLETALHLLNLNQVLRRSWTLFSCQATDLYNIQSKMIQAVLIIVAAILLAQCQVSVLMIHKWIKIRQTLVAEAVTSMHQLHPHLYRLTFQQRIPHLPAHSLDLSLHQGLNHSLLLDLTAAVKILLIDQKSN